MIKPIMNHFMDVPHIFDQLPGKTRVFRFGRPVKDFRDVQLFFNKGNRMRRFLKFFGICIHRWVEDWPDHPINNKYPYIPVGTRTCKFCNKVENIRGDIHI